MKDFGLIIIQELAIILKLNAVNKLMLTPKKDGV